MNENRIQRYALKLFYIGDNYWGFQIQPDKKTIQGEIIKALIKAKVFDDPKNANFGYSGRTDRYVHSLGQVISFNTFKKIIIPELNYYLPSDIKFYAIAKTDLDFNPRFHVKYRHYKYLIYNNNYDIELMKKASEKFIGKHDFKLLSRSPRPNNTVRIIYNIHIKELSNNIISFDVIGQSFLYEMVRRIVFVLLEIGKYNLSIEDVPKYFNPMNENKLKFGAAPVKDGGELILFNCEYDLNFEYDRYSIEQIKKLLWNHIKRNLVKSFINNLMLDFFNQINIQ